MLFRRALFYWQFIAAIALPVWVVVGRLLFGRSTGWDLLLYIVLSIALSLAMLAVVGITLARKSVRSTRTVSARDALVLGAWQLAVLLYGFVDAPLLAALIVVLAAVAFWNAVWLLFAETKQRVKNAFALPDFPVAAGDYASGSTTGPDAGRVIVIEQGRETPR